jgi:hypothetical protein
MIAKGLTTLLVEAYWHLWVESWKLRLADILEVV